ncbi:hypothetical protein D6777_04200 [Candidatus Woesearchaeota archaeon]|nr:MAG: hypothetical protein D6777_04200 [Candidatus Woesearchaeota archaeon]
MEEQPLATVTDAQIDSFLLNIESAAGIIADKESARQIVKDLVAKGYSLKMIENKLKEYNYDFFALKKFFEDLSSGKEMAAKAVEELQKLKEEKAKEEKSKKLSSRLGLVLTAFILGGVGFFMWTMLKKTTADLGDVSLVGGPAGGLMTTFTKASFIIGVAGVSVGIFLVVLMVAGHFMAKAKEKKKQEQQELQQQEEKKKETQNVMKDIESQLTTSETISEQKVEPPKLV